MVITLKSEFRNTPTEHFTEIDSYAPSMHIGSAPILIEGRPITKCTPISKAKVTPLSSTEPSEQTKVAHCGRLPRWHVAAYLLSPVRPSCSEEAVPRAV